MNPKDVKLSKSLSWILRHGAIKEGLTFDDGGFIDVDRILKVKQFKNYNESDIKRVVETNEKKRFDIRCKDGSNTLQIRANQGHSLQLDESGLLTLLSEQTVPSPVYHGTYFRNLQPIQAEGLKRMRRNHIHFTSKFPSNSDIISGIRKKSEVVLAVDSLQALTDGFKFYESSNKVILCAGNEFGVLPPKYIKEIWQVSPWKRLE